MKKYILTALITLSTIAIQAQEINWVTLNEALALQKENPKKIIMDVYTNWCGPCILLDKNTFHNPDLVEYVNENYYAVKFNAEGTQDITYKGNTFGNPNYDPKKANKNNSPHEFSNYMDIEAFPTIVFFDENGDYITPLKGYYNAQQLELYLKMFNEDKHKEINTQEKFNEYFEAFKPSFKS
ncbi:thioredoxin family protein [Tenacibaculum aquimarinum]|uniref:thioredoxin family protein n=1 Tax=Tenacibaculum aquimarinum TaxID=2910675 RepID=UPI001F0A9772|nr:thioredoxin family protein [Tenacibaculum aquimarinum]MCH3884217.1 thioredoxin family protein [Tenacibaculum aquimarinum]